MKLIEICDLGLDKYLDEVMEMNQNAYFSNGGPNNEENAENSVPLTKQMINETLSKCYLLTGLAKLKGINQYISDITENECKFLIFAHHIEVILYIYTLKFLLKTGPRWD